MKLQDIPEDLLKIAMVKYCREPHVDLEEMGEMFKGERYTALVLWLLQQYTEVKP